MHSGLSQATGITPNQKKQIEDIFTPEKIIEVSKGLTNEKRLSDSIVSLQKKIKNLKEISDEQDRRIDVLTLELIAANQFIRNSIDQVDNIADEELRFAKKPFLGLHLRGRIDLMQFDYKQPNLSVTLSYDLESISIGTSFFTLGVPNNNEYTITGTYSVFAAYKFF